jgi:L-asparagine transporter-like permease
MTKLERKVGLFGAASVGIANIIGAGIFVVNGVAAGLAGPSVILSFLLAGFIALVTALSSAELSSFITETEPVTHSPKKLLCARAYPNYLRKAMCFLFWMEKGKFLKT